MKSKSFIITIILIILLVAAGWAYWYFIMGPVTVAPANNTNQPGQSGFQPLGRPGTTATGGVTGTTTTGNTPNTTSKPPAKIPTLRLLSNTPVGGYGASTTGATTTIRWVDRGRGNVFETDMNSSGTKTLSNTVVPRIVNSLWNKNLNSFISSIFEDGDEVPTTVYVDIIPQKIPSQAASSTNLANGEQVAPYSLRGKNISGDLISMATSPDKSQVFMLINESGSGVGYISNFDGSKMTKIFNTPLTQIVADWPANDVISITTKASASLNGFLYFVNPKTGVWDKVLGPMMGLSTSVSHDGKYVLYSSVGSNSTLYTGIYSIKTRKTSDAIIRTLADKCTWGNLNKEIVYCGVPNDNINAVVPDEWYLGTVSTADKIWQENAATGEVHLVSNVIDVADRIIDTYYLTLDSKDRYLFFVNKNDLSLWSLDLVLTK